MPGRAKAVQLRVEQPEQRDASAHVYGFTRGATSSPCLVFGLACGGPGRGPGWSSRININDPRSGFRSEGQSRCSRISTIGDVLINSSSSV